MLEQLQPLLAQHLVVRHLAGDIGNEGERARGARGDLGVTAARATGAGRRTRIVLRVHGVFLTAGYGVAREGAYAAIMGTPCPRN